MTLHWIIVAIFIVGLISPVPIALTEDWGIKVKTLPPSPNPNPNDMNALHLVLANFTVQCPTGEVSPLVYNETSFVLTFNVVVAREPIPIPDVSIADTECPNHTIIQLYAPINITFPTTVQNPNANIGIYVDGNHNGYILTAHDGKWILSFEVPYGLHTVLLNLDPYQFPVAVIPEFPSGSLVLIVIMATMLLTVLATRKQLLKRIFKPNKTL
jgi:hypothetical protein